MDVGQPKDYLTGMSLYLNYVRHSYPDRLARENSTVGNVLVVRFVVLIFVSFEQTSFSYRIQQLKSANVVELVQMLLLDRESSSKMVFV